MPGARCSSLTPGGRTEGRSTEATSVRGGRVGAQRSRPFGRPHAPSHTMVVFGITRGAYGMNAMRRAWSSALCRCHWCGSAAAAAAAGAGAPPPPPPPRLDSAWPVGGLGALRLGGLDARSGSDSDVVCCEENSALEAA